ncbi:MAG: MraY family glycosyltransferase [Alphaproteobacteria bacterium]
MLEVALALLTFTILTLLSYLLTRVVRDYTLKHKILDLPNPRSSHKTPIPKGGGIAILIVFITVMLIYAFLCPPVITKVIFTLIGGTLILAALSWEDDTKHVPALLRLAIYGFIVAIGMRTLGDKMVFQGILPFWLDRSATFLLWVWFINLFNFMDGIDGLAATETICITLGMALIILLKGYGLWIAVPHLTLAAAALGFLFINWSPAKVFLSDVGSIPLGFILGWYLLKFAANGYWAVALILPLYYLTDASITLARRILRKEKFWEAHKEHFYQKAVNISGHTHKQVVRIILVVNIILIALAASSLHPSAPALLAPALAVLTVTLGITLLGYTKK